MKNQASVLQFSEPSEGERIHNPSEIESMLKTVSERVSAVTLLPKDTEHALTAYIKYVSQEDGWIRFDPPMPENRRHLLANQKVTLMTRHNGCQVTCHDIELIPEQKANGELRYWAKFPEEISYLQRRSTFRVPVRPLLNIITHLNSDKEQRHSGRLRDLSQEGCRLEFNEDLTLVDSLRASDLRITLCLPNGESHDLALNVLRIDYHPSTQTTFLGCRFGELTPQQRQHINLLVNELQRDFIQFTRKGFVENTSALFIPKRKQVISEIQRTEPSLPETEQKSVLSKLNKRDQSAPIQPERAYDSAIIAIKQLVIKFRAGQPLPIDQALDASHQLVKAWQQDRQALLMQRYRRNPLSPLFDHSVSVALLLLDIVASRYPDQAQTPTLTGMVLGGFCHDLAYSLLPGGLRYQTGLKQDAEHKALKAAHASLMRKLKASPDMTPEALRIVRESNELLDGSGWPDGLNGDSLSQVGKLCACINAFDRYSHTEHQGDLIYDPIAGMQNLLKQAALYDKASLKFLWRHLGKYPQGSLVTLNDKTLAMVMRHDDQGQARDLRRVYCLENESVTPHQDFNIQNTNLEILGYANPKKFNIAFDVLRAPLKSI